MADARDASRVKTAVMAVGCTARRAGMQMAVPRSRTVVVCPAALWYDEGFRASGNNSVVECDLAKVEVAGSNPVSRSIF